MFEGGGFGVGLTVADLRPRPVEVLPPEGVDPAALLPPGATARPARLGEMLPVTSRSDSELAAELQRVVKAEARLAAYKAELVYEFATRRPDTLDVPRGKPGSASENWADERKLAGTSEFFEDELALVLNCSRGAATALTQTTATLLERLPDTWAALADGQLDWSRARALATELGWPARDTDPSVIAEVEAAILPRAAALSVKRLRAAARKELMARDAAAAERRRAEAEKTADVTVRSSGDGMSELYCLMPTPLANAVRETVDAYARMLKADGDPRPIGQLRAGILADLVLRPWDTSRPPVTAILTVIAPLMSFVRSAGFTSDRTAGPDAEHTGASAGWWSGAAPGEPDFRGFGGRGGAFGSWAGAFDGQGGVFGSSLPAEVNEEPITHAQLRTLLEQLDGLCPGGLQAPAGGALDIAIVDPETGALRATVSRTELERMVRRGCPEHPPSSSGPRGRSRSPGTGDSDLDVARDTCNCSVLDRPPPIDRYEPTPAHRRFVKTRDRTCRHPGCRNRAGWADLDHVIAHALGGETDCSNLCCLCRKHHRLKTKARGWRFVMTPDGVLSVTTPSGVTRSTRPPGLDDLVPAKGSAPPSMHEDDPPPF